MIVMLDTSHPLDEAEKELGCRVEQPCTPLTKFNRQRPDDMFCIDNGAYAGLNIPSFLSLLDREYESRAKCRWIAVPDVVISAIRTLEGCDCIHFIQCWSPIRYRNAIKEGGVFLWVGDVSTHCPPSLL